MAEIKFDQFKFTQGEIDPRIQSRADWDGYYASLKYARNVQVIPQGGVQRRWGTIYVDTCTVGDANAPNEFEISTLIYDDSAIYLMVWEALSCKVYLENVLVATIVTTYEAEDIQNLRFTQVENRLIITNLNFKPRQIIRSANAANAIASVDTTNMYLHLTTPGTTGQVLPVQFTTAGSLPTTNPQIYTGRTYYLRFINTQDVRIFNNSFDAINNINYFSVSALGSASNAVIQNTWAISDVTFINTPAYDFDGGYSAITFTPSATSGNAVTITASSAWGGTGFTSAFVGGLFEGNGGSLRIVSVGGGGTTATGYTIHSFVDTSAIEGTLAFVGEPAWSDARGWPKYGSFFQNRLVFGGNYSLPNGVWLSVINSAFNFDDSQALDSDAISWYPAGGSINTIVGITSARSLLIHTNNGTFSTPLLSEQPVTPTNFVLTEQNKFSVQPIQPIFIDNQIIFVDTASNVINMIWEITQSAFITNNISVMSSSLITSPVDMASFYEPKATDGFYALFVNTDGTLAVYQTLHEQGIGAWSLMNTTTANVANSIASIDTVNDYIILTDSLVSGEIYPVTFTTTDTLPTTIPQIYEDTTYYMLAVTQTTMRLFTSYADAENNVDWIAIRSIGSSSSANIINTSNFIHVITGNNRCWFLIQRLTPTGLKIFIEELSFNVLTDAATIVNLSAPSTTVTGLSYLNGQTVNVKGDGFVLQDRVVSGGQITTEQASQYYEVGLNYVSQITPLPISIPQTMGILYNPNHIRALWVRYYQSIGVTIQGFGMPIQVMQDVQLDTFPYPKDGVYLFTPMEGWTNFDASGANDINITQTYPLPMTILGLSYVLEV